MGKQFRVPFFLEGLATQIWKYEQLLQQWGLDLKQDFPPPSVIQIQAPTVDASGGGRAVCMHGFTHLT